MKSAVVFESRHSHRWAVCNNMLNDVLLDYATLETQTPEESRLSVITRFQQLESMRNEIRRLRAEIRQITEEDDEDIGWA